MKDLFRAFLIGGILSILGISLPLIVMIAILENIYVNLLKD